MRPGGGPRVTSGRLAGRRLEAPDSIRPSSARVREALFSIWTNRIADAELLDLYAGSGSIGIEGWSRGARRVTFAESDRRSLACLRSNLELLPAAQKRVLAESVATALERLAGEGARFDLLFADPPYEVALEDAFFAAAARVAAAGAELIVEHRSRAGAAEAPSGWRRLAVRRYGDSGLSIYEPISNEDPNDGSCASRKNANSSR